MKIVTFSTYRTSKLLHGGQIRLNALHDTLRRDGFLVRHVSVHTGDEENLSADEISIPLDVSAQTYFHKSKMRTDVNACSVFDLNPDKYRVLENGLNEFDPELLWLEQPWLWPVVKRYLSENNRSHTAVVYGSQNVEFNLIDATASEWDAATRHKLARQIEDLEHDLCQRADGICAVSMSDLKHFETYKKPVLLAQNGVSPQQAPGGIDYWRNVYRYTSLCTFVGSAHPPNAEGFSAMMGQDLSFMAPDEKIAVIGGVCSLLRNMPAFRKNRGLILPRLALLDNQDGGGLSTFFHLSKAILLPIVSGGGTNLKTAEALYSRKPIVATTRAFRGYEPFMGLPNVHISDDPKKFRLLLKQQLANESQSSTLTDEHADALNNLLWSRTMMNVGRWVQDVNANTKAAAFRTAALSTFKVVPIHKSTKSLVSEGILLKPLLHNGWHSFEEEGTWSKERIATLKIQNPFVESTIRVTIEVEVMIFHGDHNAIDIYTASAHHTSKICDFKSRNMTFSFTTTEKDIGSDNSLELYFQVQKLYQPRSKNNVGDERLLGCRLKKVTLQSTFEESSSRQMVVYRKRKFSDRVRRMLRL